MGGPPHDKYRHTVRSLSNATCPQSVPDELWDKCQAIKKERAGGTLLEGSGGTSYNTRKMWGMASSFGKDLYITGTRMSL